MEVFSQNFTLTFCRRGRTFICEKKIENPIHSAIVNADSKDWRRGFCSHPTPMTTPTHHFPTAEARRFATTAHPLSPSQRRSYTALATILITTLLLAWAVMG